MKKINVYLILSVFFNVIILITGIRLINGLGGIPYLKEKYYGKENETEYSKLYKNKISAHKKLPVTNKDILFIGDSLTDYFEWNEIFSDFNVKNRGIAGDDVQGVLNRINPLLASKPAKIFLMIGINDLNRKNNVQKTISEYNKLLNRIKSLSPTTNVYVESILPRRSSDSTFNTNVISVNKFLYTFSEANKYKYVNLFDSFTDKSGNLDQKYTTDGLHLNAEGYNIWKNKIQDYVSE